MNNSQQQKTWITIYKKGFLNVFVPFGKCFVFLLVMASAIAVLRHGITGLENQQLWIFLKAIGVFSLIFSFAGGFNAIHLHLKKTAKLNDLPFSAFKLMGFEVVDGQLKGEFQSYPITLEWKQVYTDERSLEAINISIDEVEIENPDLKTMQCFGHFEHPIHFTANTVTYQIPYDKHPPSPSLISKRITEVITLIEASEMELVAA